MGVLVIDIGTSGLRAGLVRHDGTLHFLNYEACRPDTPTPGLVEFDAQKLAEAALRVCNLTIEQSRKTDKIVAVGITNQRASTVIWSKSTGKPFGPASKDAKDLSFLKCKKSLTKGLTGAII